MLVHLHTLSHYSFLRALPSPQELADAAAAHDMPALALTDHHGLTGAVEFYRACNTTGIKPILGLELTVAAAFDLPPRTGRLVLLARDRTGWANLCRLSSALLTDPVHIKAGHLPFETLADHASGLVCLTGGSRGLVTRLMDSPAGARLLGQLAEVFAGRLYVELQLHTPSDGERMARLAELAVRHSLPVVATQSVHYMNARQLPLQRLLAAMRRNTTLEALPPEEAAPPHAHFASAAEMQRNFAAYPQALAATQEIADRCSLTLPLGEKHYPVLDLPTGATAEDELRRAALAGLAARNPAGNAEISARLEHELQIIIERGYAPLFLIMREIVAFARNAGVPTASRGSASSSLVAHCLGITTPDPIRENLYFERFLNPARASAPDIDLDLCSKRRGIVIRHVYEQYGEDHVAMVATINRFRARSALREVAKAHGLPTADIKALAAALPRRSWGPPGRRTTDREALTALAEQTPHGTTRAVLRDATAILGLPRHLSIHPGGVVIAPGQLTDLAPTQLASKGVAITQFDLDAVEALGLVKIDLLGIRGLSVLGDVAEQIHAGAARSLDLLEAIPDDDPDTAKLVRAGDTIGCFNIESNGMRLTLKEVQAHSPDDITVALALFRPGPLTGGLKDAFVRRHLGQEPVEYLHPALTGLLAETHGVILYQEQVLRIAHEIAGLSLADADLLRRAMSHFDPGAQMRTLKERFMAGALLQRGVPASVSERIWDLMAAFAGYGFPKAHAASYARVAWRGAWAKAHHPAEFMAAVLANWGGYYSQRVYLSEARRMGLTVRPPHVNHSMHQFSVVYRDTAPALYMGLTQVRDVRKRTAQRIIAARPFGSLMDFLTRVNPQPKEAANLVRCGALAGLGSQPAMLRQVEAGGWQGGQLALFGSAEVDDVSWPLETRVAHEEAVLGVGVSAHPLELIASQLDASVVSTVEAAGQVGARVRLAGIRQTARGERDRKGALYYRVELEDTHGTLDVIMPGQLYRRHREAWRARRAVVVEGTVEMNPGLGSPELRAERVEAVPAQPIAK